VGSSISRGGSLAVKKKEERNAHAKKQKTPQTQQLPQVSLGFFPPQWELGHCLS
jgi:hypothetical protein